jgi:mRNA interferase MazF
MRPVINRGEVWWAEIPNDRVRPVVVLTRQRFTSRLTTLLVVPVSTRIRGIPTEVALGKDDGLTRECVATFDNVQAVDRSRFKQRIAQLSADRMSEVCRAYRFAAGC